MGKDLLAKLQKTESITLPGGVVRPHDDAERASAIRRFWISATRSGGIPDMCDD